jgi:peptide/nickel transport system substrate-binding protein
MSQIRPNWSIRRNPSRLWLWLSLLALAPPAYAAEERLCDLPPFDQIILDADNKNKVLEVETLDLPDHKVPANPQGELKLRLLADPTRPFVVSWDNVTKVLLFEDHLMQEARQLTADGKYDDAFDYYARLLRDYPTFPGLNDAVNEYLRRNAIDLEKSGQHERALAVLTSLYQRQPNAPGLVDAVDSVCGAVVQQYLRDKNYSAARGVLELWQKEFNSLHSTAAAAWQERFVAAAARQVDEARQLVAAKQYVEARKAMGRARDIWPDNREADALLAEIQQQNPTVSVGVFEASPREPVRRVDDWASLRASRLLAPTITELIGFGSEGGVYQSPYGEWTPDDSGLRLTLKLKDPPGGNGDSVPSADVIARFLLHMADPLRPEFQPDFAALLAGVSVEGTNLIHLDWKRPHVRPESLLERPLTKRKRGSDGREMLVAVTPPAWTIADSGPAGTLYSAVPGTGAPQPWLKTIIEQPISDDQAAVDALVNGEIDVLDRVPPWQLAQLRAARDVHVASYALPTVHVLVLNPARPLSKEREFRRALCFGIDRQRIVQQVLLGGTDVAGYSVVSGPFPPGLSFSDPLRYAYNSQIDPRPFEPRLAAVLAAVAWAKVIDPTGKGEVERKPMPTLVLAHPADPVARVACESIQVELGNIGIPIKLVEFTADELLAGKVDYDLRYAELAVWEPVADARALLGPDGLAGGLCSPYLAAALRDLDGMTNWKDVRAKLAEIHDVAQHDLPLIPLWQTVNYFAYRTGVQGIGEAPVSLYQNVDRWRVGAGSTMAELSRQP